ncbi:MAG: 4'-phosphopantetheinyl transferase superfamily protein [Prevotella sp.]|nr:4'-phosphopantetheinyl transferase superfamily protein [Prevotella sp.]
MVYIDEHIDDFDLQAALPEISEQRRLQALRFKFERGQRTCVLAYLLLKKALREEYGLTENPLFEYGPHGKPFIVGHPEIHFSLSHCREAVACAVSDRPVGIDVESVQRYRESLAQYTMNDEEQQLIAAAERPDVAFIRLWTMKEARLKLTGEGITNDLKSALSGGSWQFTTVERLDKNYIYTLCEEKASSDL